MSTLEVQVEGMTCQHCVQAVRTSIDALGGIDQISIDLATGNVQLEGASIDQAAVEQAVHDAGYSLSAT